MSCTKHITITLPSFFFQKEITMLRNLSVYCTSNVKPHAGWSIFLCNLSENECSEQVSENFRNGKIFRRQKESRENTHPGNMCDIVFKKGKERGWTVNRMSVYAETAV